MNWTGGSLSRHSAVAGSLKNLQKQHFAKVRGSRVVKKTSPFKWTAFSRSVRETAICPRSSGSYTDPVRKQSAPADEELEHSLPLVKSPPPRQDGFDIIQRESRVGSEDLYSATPPPRKTKRRRQKFDAKLEHRARDSVSEKRQRILRQGDWVGIGIQEPLKIVFMSPRKADQVGKRRKPSDGHRAIYNKRQDLLPSPLVQTRNQQTPLPYSGSLQGLRPVRSDVRISIGGRQVQPGSSSSSRASKFRHPSTHYYVSKRSRGTSIDVMLLDGEEGLRSADTVQDLRNGHAGLPAFSGRRAIPGALFAGPVGFGDETRQPSQRRPWAETCVRHLEVGPKFGRQDSDTLYSSGKHPVSFSCCTSFHQPTPLTPRISQLLRSSSSDGASSTAAQIFPCRPKVPSSQVLANNEWEAWMAAQCEADQQYSSQYNDGENFRVLEEPSISPGVSEAIVVRRGRHPQFRRQQRLISVLNQPKLGGETRAFLPQSVSHEGSNITQGLAVTTHTDKSKVDQRRPAKDVLMEVPRHSHEAVIVPATTTHDTDHLWKKFVFGSSSDEEKFTVRHDTEFGEDLAPFFSNMPLPVFGAHSVADRSNSNIWFDDFVSTSSPNLAEVGSSSSLDKRNEISYQRYFSMDPQTGHNFQRSQRSPSGSSPCETQSDLMAASLEVKYNVKDISLKYNFPGVSSPLRKQIIDPSQSTSPTTSEGKVSQNQDKWLPIGHRPDVRGQGGITKTERTHDIYSLLASSETDEAENTDDIGINRDWL